MPLITDTLTDITGELTDYSSIMVRSGVRAGSTSLITPETKEIPVVEGEVSFHAEPGAGMLILRREKTQYSRQEIIPIWVPEYDTTMREVIMLGKTHTNADGDTAQDLVEQLLSTITGAVAEGLAQIEEAAEGTVDLSSYATLTYVDEQIEQIELTPGKDGKDGKDGGPGASAYEVWLSAGNTGTETDFLSSLKGEDGQDGDDGKDGGPGASAYETWISAGNTGTETEFLSSLKGEDGQDGQDGDDGQPGASAYELWISAGNTGTETDFLSSLKGEDGQDGKDGKDGNPGASAYELWISAGNTGTEEVFISSLKGEDGVDGKDGKDGQDGDPLTVTSTTETQDGVELSLSDGTTVIIPRGPKGNPGQDGISPHIDQVSGNWFIGDYDTGVQAQGPKGDSEDGNGGGTSAVLKTTMGFPQETEGVEPGEIWIETFSGLTFRAKGSFGMIPADMSAVYPVGQDPTGMPDLYQLPAGVILTDDGTNFWQLQTGGEVKKVQAGGLNHAQQLYGYGTMPPGTAFKIDRDDDPDYPAGLYLISDVPPVTGWTQFTMSPDALLTHMLLVQDRQIQELESRITALENPTE